MKKRFFLAVEIPEALKTKISQFQKTLEQKIPAKWTARENFHLTLIFLGETNKPKEIEESLRRIKMAHFAVEAGGLGFFPNPRYPRIFWLGIKKSPKLLELYDALKNQLQKIGFVIGKKDFSPHITLARFKNKVNLKEAKKYQNISFGEIPVREICLFESQLLPKKAKYQKCFTIALQ